MFFGKWGFFDSSGLAKNIPRFHVRDFTAGKETDTMSRIPVTVISIAITLLVATFAFFFLHYPRKNPPPCSTAFENNATNVSAHALTATETTDPAVVSSDSPLERNEDAPPAVRERLSDHEAARLGLASIGCSGPKAGWHKVERDNELIRVSIPRLENLDGSSGYEKGEFVHLWIDPWTGTVVDPPGLPPAPMDKETVLEMMKSVHVSFHKQLFAKHPVGSVQIVPGLARVSFLVTAPPKKNTDTTGFVLDETPVFAEEYFDTRTGTTVIIERKGQ